MPFIANVAAPCVDIDKLCELKTSEEMIAFENAFRESDAENYSVNPDGSEIWTGRVFNDGETPSKPIHIDAELIKIRERLNDEESSCGEAEPFEVRDAGDHYEALSYMHSGIWHYSNGTTRES